ncbi:MAG: hypothetical protein JRE38_01870 [Deltaproteobacteria bacterium]|nr:hypothetical protein [Deltaproteobacteria bacterium]MBW2576796.1 hypothetical protein [Deltaproteobacteria bacterium]MBW2691661.1 hypothetical protein [Deltaproteobacteria bacterium]
MQLSTTKRREQAIAPLAVPEEVRDEQIAGILREALDLRAELPWARLDSEFSIDLSNSCSLECGLTSNDKVFFVSDCNDFLLRSQDASWAEALFPNRVHFFERDGHLGNLHRQDMRKAIARFVDTPSS